MPERTDGPAEQQARQQRLAGLAEPTTRLRSYTAFAFWTLAGAGGRRGLQPHALTPAQRLVFLAAAHHTDCAAIAGGRPLLRAAELAGLTAIPHPRVAAALRRLARHGWLRAVVGGYLMPAAAEAFVTSGVLEDPYLRGDPLIEVLDDTGSHP